MRIFGSGEFSDTRVKILIGTLFIISLAAWFKNPFLLFGVINGENFSVSCPPVFEGCYQHVFNAKTWLEESFGEFWPNIMQMVALLPIEIGVLALLTNRFKLAWACLLVVFFMRAAAMLTTYPILNFDFYDIVFLFAVLFLPNKIFSAKIVYVFIYFLCSTIKFDDGWTVAGYFLSLKEGLPLIGKNEGAVITVSNLVILSQIFFGWGLIAGNSVVRKISFAFFLLFHLYSTAIVGLRFPMSTLPLLFVLFAWDLKDEWKERESARHIKGFYFPEGVPLRTGRLVLGAFCCILLIAQVWKIAIPGQEKLTFSGSGASFFMFDGNRQCAVAYEKKGDDGAFKIEFEIGNVFAQNRCSVANYYSVGRKMFCQEAGNSIYMTVMSSLNGSELYKTVERVDICQTDYKVFGNNDWIKTEQSAKTGIRVVENTYRNLGGQNTPMILSDDGRFAHSEINSLEKGFKIIEESAGEKYSLLSKVLSTTYWLAFLLICAIFFWKLSFKAPEASKL